MCHVVFKDGFRECMNMIVSMIRGKQLDRFNVGTERTGLTLLVPRRISPVLYPEL